MDNLGPAGRFEGISFKLDFKLGVKFRELVSKTVTFGATGGVGKKYALAVSG